MAGVVDLGRAGGDGWGWSWRTRRRPAAPAGAGRWPTLRVTAVSEGGRDGKKKHKQQQHQGPGRGGVYQEADPPPKLKRKTYERELRRLHGELVAMQEWVKASGAKICVVFEGRDTAGKGGTIKRITERVSPRTFRVVALPAPTERSGPDVHAALCPPLPSRRGGRDL